MQMFGSWKNTTYIYTHTHIVRYVDVGSSPVLEPHTMGWGGMGWDANVHVKLQKQLMLCARGVGWGGMGWDVNFHVKLQLMLCARGVGWVGWGGDVNVHVKLQWMPAWLKANGITGLATRTSGRRRERSSKLCETYSCCEETKNRTSLTCF